MSMYSKINEQQLNINLVEEIERHPVLYNARHPGHTRQDALQTAWSIVSRKVHMPASQCKERWKNIRVVFARHMKPAKNGAKKPRRAYYLLEAMQFAIPHMKVLAAAQKNMPKTPQKKEPENEEFEESGSENDNTIESETHSPLQQVTVSPSPPSSPQHSTPITNMSQKQPRSSDVTQSKRALQNDEVSNEFTEGSQSKRHTNYSPEHAEGLKMFLLSMLPDLLKMSDEQVRRFKHRALDAVDDIMSNQSTVRSRHSLPSRHTARSQNEYQIEVIDDTLLGE